MDKEQIIKNLRELANLDNFDESYIAEENDPDFQLLEELKNCKSRADILEMIRNWTRKKQTELFRFFLTDEIRIDRIRQRQERMKQRIRKLGELEECEEAEDMEELEDLIGEIQKEFKIVG